MEKRAALVLLVASLLAVAIMPLELLLVKSLIDQVQTWTLLDPIEPILIMAVWLGVLMLVNNIPLGVPIPLAMTKLNEASTLEEQRLLVTKTSLLPLSAVESPQVKDMRERAFQVSLYEIFYTGVQLLQVSLQIVVIIAILLLFGQWIPIVVILASSLLLFFVSGKTTKSLENLTRKQTASRRMLQHYVELMTEKTAAKEIRLFGLSQVLTGRWARLYEKQSTETIKASRSTEIRKIGPELQMAIVGGILLALVVLLPGAETLSSGDFALLFMALTMLLSQLPVLIGHLVAMQRHYMKWEDFQAYLELGEERQLQMPTKAPSAQQGEGRIRLQVSNLGFRYPNGSGEMLKEISFTIPEGCHAVLVGENGSGKSTLIKLLLGLYSPDEGEIRWSTSTNSTLEKSTIHNRLSVVFQDFTKLQLTLRENVALGKLSALDQDSLLQNSLQSVGSKLTQLDTQLGASFGGVEPSGGEWQKIATARAMLRDAQFVFFDEPTAALDPKAEKAAFELFRQVTKSKSALLVTHRLGAARSADLILVMKNGRLVEQGNHEELMANKGPYRQMYDLQASWYV